MKVLVACEYSGTVRDAFIRAGHEAMSCDLLPTDVPGPHHQGDALELLDAGWDLLIAHPPCTDLAVSGNRHMAAKLADGRTAAGLELVRKFMLAPIPRIAVENPVSVIASNIRPSDQTIQPWQFGHGEVKATCLWLKNLPPLVPTDIVPGRVDRIHKLGPSADRWKLRSTTYPGIAAAMAAQWGNADQFPLQLDIFQELTA
ncbi:DNA methyltransferase [Arthrobacter phage SerialPhiller]|nr:DNA methyltransferase [Arthrobacter phage Arielagos]WNT45252.1 DNA methyltransferase [Arthrobacter phage SerialPhiller]